MPFRLSRRQIISAMASVGVVIGGPHAFAQKKVPIIGGDDAPTPIAIPNFIAGSPADGEVGVGVAQVITDNPKRSGLFAPIDPAAVIENHNRPQFN